MADCDFSKFSYSPHISKITKSNVTQIARTLSGYYFVCFDIENLLANLERNSIPNYQLI